MQSKTLLSVVQSAMAATGGDPVSTISETPESEDLAIMCRDVFYDILYWEEWPHLNKIATLETPIDVNAPTTIRIKDDFKFIHKAQYLQVDPDGNERGFTDLEYIEPEFFIDRADGLFNKEHTTKVTGYGVDPSTFILVETDKHPTYYTTFDNEHIIFDSYDSEVDPYISNYKTRVMAEVIPNFKMDDSYEIEIPNNMMGLYMSQVKVAAFYYLNQTNNPLDGNKSLRHMSKLRQYRSRVVNDKEEHYPQGNYSRRPNGANGIKLGRR